MDYKIGKIHNYNKKTGVGYIITNNEEYIFTIDDLNEDKNNYNDGDIVKFKGEKVYNTNKAFFIKKLTNNNNKNNH